MDYFRYPLDKENFSCRWTVPSKVLWIIDLYLLQIIQGLCTLKFHAIVPQLKKIWIYGHNYWHNPLVINVLITETQIFIFAPFYPLSSNFSHCWQLLDSMFQGSKSFHVGASKGPCKLSNPPASSPSPDIVQPVVFPLFGETCPPWGPGVWWHYTTSAFYRTTQHKALHTRWRWVEGLVILPLFCLSPVFLSAVLYLWLTREWTKGKYINMWVIVTSHIVWS